MKKKVIAILAAVAALSGSALIACGGDKANTGADTGTGTSTETGTGTGTETGSGGGTQTVSYSVKWYDEEGTLLTTTTVNSGSVPSYTYEKQDTEEWDYTFEGWAATQDGEVITTLPAASGDTVYYAVVSKKEIVPEIKFTTEASAADVRVTAAAALKSRYTAEVASLGTAAKAEALFVYEMYQYGIDKITGTAAEAKAKANEIYAKLVKLIRSIKSTPEGIDGKKEQILYRLDAMHDGVKYVVGEVAALETAYNNAKTAIQQAAESGILETKLNEFKTAVSENVTAAINAVITELKSALKTELDAKVDDLLDKLDDAELKEQLQDYYTAEIAKIEAISSMGDVRAALSDIKGDTIQKGTEIAASQLKKLKDKALDDLDELVEEALAKMKDGELKDELNTFYATERAKIAAVDSIDSAKTVGPQVLSDTQEFIADILQREIDKAKNTVKGYVNELKSALNASAYDYIPAAMCPGYAANLVAEKPEKDYTSPVNISDINYGGFGAQWNMVVENINNIESCYKVFSKVDAVAVTAINAINDAIIAADTVLTSKTIENSDYKIVFAYDDGKVTLGVQYKTGVTVAQVGSVVPTLEMTYDIQKAEREMYVKLTDTNAVRYIVSDKKFEFALTLGAAVANTTSYCTINKNGENISGKIYEYITASGNDRKESAAEFYTDGTYLTAVGSKADTINGFKGYVTEVYKKNEGKLLGFKVKETISAGPIAGTYHTLWFNLNDISGITKVKITDETHDKSENSTYFNGSDTRFEPTYNSKHIIGNTSRKHDVEMKLRYFYGMKNGELVKYEVQVPMMFIQDDNNKDHNYTDFPEDMSKQGITASVTMSNAVLGKIKTEYSNRIDTFIENKSNMTSAQIKQFIDPEEE